MKRNKIATAEEAIGIIQDGDVMAAAGFVGNGTPEELIIALEKRFLENGEPKNITLLFSSGLGDAKERGLNRLAQKGLFKRVIAGHYGLMPKIGQMALDNEFEAYNFPQGILTNLYRAVAGRQPGVFSKVGLVRMKSATMSASARMTRERSGLIRSPAFSSASRWPAIRP